MLDYKLCCGNLTGTYYSSRDYNPGPYSITIPAGETTVSFNISILNEGSFTEANETFELYISKGSLSSNFLIGSVNRTTVTIVGNGCKYTCIAM